MHAVIRALSYHLPEGVVTNADLARRFPAWSQEKIAEKIGITHRHVAAQGECASDLAVKAAEKLFSQGHCGPEDIDFLLFCTQSPDYLLPTTACLLQHRLGLPTSVGALDVNLGCSGYVYGLALAKGLIETGQARRVLFLTGDTYSKFLREDDHGVRTLFGDAATATLLCATDTTAGDGPWIGPFQFGTDGKGGPNLMVRTGGLRCPRAAEGADAAAPSLRMNGPEIFAFTLRAVPQLVQELLTVSGVPRERIKLFVLHQANLYMLEHLRKKLAIPPEQFCVCLKDVGNTVSSTIPIALAHAAVKGELAAGDIAMLVGFGVGYSWGAALVRWPSIVHCDASLRAPLARPA